VNNTDIFKYTTGIFPSPVTLFSIKEEKVFTDFAKRLKSEVKKDKNEAAKRAHYFSDNSYVLDLKEIAPLKTFISSKLTLFLNKVLSVQGEAHITQSWVNLNAPGQITNIHPHPNSIVSGVVYLETNFENGDIMFHRHAENNGCSWYSLVPRYYADVVMNPFQHATCSFKVRTGDLLMFPSYLLHSVPRNTTTVDRWSLAFNAISTNKLGTIDTLTELSCGAN